MPKEVSKKVADRTDVRKGQFIEALEQALGNVSIASRSTGTPRSVHYEWYNEDKAYAKKVDAIRDVAIDFVESQLMQQIKNGEVAPTIFYLKTIGKKRGYTEHIDHGVTGGVQILGFGDKRIEVSE